MEQGVSILQSSKKLGIKFSTAKLIIKRFKETGDVFETKKERKARLKHIPRTDKSFNMTNQLKNNDKTEARTF